MVVFAIVGDGPDASATVPEKLSILCIVMMAVADEPCCTLRLDGLDTMLISGDEPFEILHAVSGCSSQEEYPCPGLEGGCHVTNPWTSIFCVGLRASKVELLQTVPAPQNPAAIQSRSISSRMQIFGFGLSRVSQLPVYSDVSWNTP